MSLILAIRANGKAYFMADRRILSGYSIERDQGKMVILSSRKDGHAHDIVIGVCGEVRMMTILNDARIQSKLLQAYQDAPTICGMVDAIRGAFVANGIKPEEAPGGASRFVLGLLIGIDGDVYDVSRTLTIIGIPPDELCAIGSGSEAACAFWAGKGHMPGAITPVLEGDDLARAIDDVHRLRLQNVFDYVSRVDTCVGATTDFYSYDLPSAPSPSTP